VEYMVRSAWCTVHGVEYMVYSVRVVYSSHIAVHHECLVPIVHLYSAEPTFLRIYEGVFNTSGAMLAQAVTGTPGHVNSMEESVGHFLRHFPLDTMKVRDEGDTGGKRDRGGGRGGARAMRGARETYEIAWCVGGVRLELLRNGP
jgi:hypothetical protein